MGQQLERFTRILAYKMDNLLMFLDFVFQIRDFPFYKSPMEQQLDIFTPYFGAKKKNVFGFRVSNTEFFHFIYKPPMEQQLDIFYPTFWCIKWIIFECVWISCFEYWIFPFYKPPVPSTEAKLTLHIFL